MGAYRSFFVVAALAVGCGGRESGTSLGTASVAGAGASSGLTASTASEASAPVPCIPTSCDSNCVDNCGNACARTENCLNGPAPLPACADFVSCVASDNCGNPCDFDKPFPCPSAVCVPTSCIETCTNDCETKISTNVWVSATWAAGPCAPTLDASSDGAVRAGEAWPDGGPSSDASLEGGSCSIRASDYDQSCTSASDCVGVTDGDFCATGACTNCAPNAAIRLSAQSQYESDFANAVPNGCPTTPCVGSALYCNKGTCAVCLTGLLCNGVCVDEQTDLNNCGGCGTTCPTGQVCQSGSCGNPWSCQSGGPGMTNCGPGGQGTESCCTSLEVTGGTYYRNYETFGGVPENEYDPATVSSFRLDKYLVTVGRFRQFVNAWNGGNGWLPTAEAGKHAQLNGGQGLVDVGVPADAGVVYEPGWVATDDSNIAPTDDNLACTPPYDTWTNTSGTQENLPINCVNWYEAYAFCIWDGGFLPSEAEWEYAAAGGSQQREYPWGSTAPGTACPGTGCQYAIYNFDYPNGSGKASGVTNIAPVGTATLGAGLWGQLDLAGQVFEWNLDLSAFSPTYVVPASYVDPCTDCAVLTAAAPNIRVARGGNFYDVASYLVPSYRGYGTPAGRTFTFGVRCARAP